MDGNLQLIRNDLWILTQQILADAVDEDNGKKLRIGEVLGVLAPAIEEDEIQSLARTITGWANETLVGRKVELPN
ncbi:MAG: hypothetical protein ACXWWB_09700 [Nitrospira sp.]